MSAEHVLHLPTSWLLQLADALPERHHVIFSRITSMKYIVASWLKHNFAASLQMGSSADECSLHATQVERLPH